MRFGQVAQFWPVFIFADIDKMCGGGVVFTAAVNIDAFVSEQTGEAGMVGVQG